MGNSIRIEVTAICRDYVRIGIDAPPEVPIFREEIYLTIQEEQAAGTTGSVSGKASRRSRKRTSVRG